MLDETKAHVNSTVFHVVLKKFATSLEISPSQFTWVLSAVLHVSKCADLCKLQAELHRFHWSICLHRYKSWV